MKRCLLKLFFLIGLLLSAFQASAQRFSFDQGQTKGKIEFMLTNNLLIIPVFINDRGPFNFILDTGVGPMIITDPELGSFLEKHNYPMFRMRGRGIGPEIEAYIINNLNTKIGEASMSNFSGILLKNDPFQLSSYMGMTIHGIIGSSFFSSFIVKIDYLGRTVSFFHPDYPPRMRGKKMPIQLIQDKPYLDIELTTTDNKKDTLLLLLDTGAGHAISLDLSEEEEWIKPQKTIVANLGVGLGGEINGLIGRMQQVKIGDYTFKKVIASFPEYEDEDLRTIMTSRDGAIGGEILKRFTVYLNYFKGEVYLRKNRHFRAPFEHDMSGMEIYMLFGKDKRFMISRIEPKSPADRAEFLVDDEILSINFVSVKEFTIDEISTLLQKETTGNLVFEILREDQILFKFLQLRRRI